MFHKPDSTVWSKSTATATTSAGRSGSKDKAKGVDVALRKSDRRKILYEAEAAFGVVPSGLKICNQDDNDPQQQQQEHVKTMLTCAFLQGTLSVRKIAHPQLNRVQLYFRSPRLSRNENDNDNWPFQSTTQCVWMTVDDNGSIAHAPTVALLAALSIAPSSSNKNQQPPFSFPTVIVHSHVSKFLCRGAHLMRAGMTCLPSLLDSSRSDDGTSSRRIVAIAVHGNPQPFAVGRLTPRTTNETIGPAGKGVGVEIWTCLGDDLCNHSAMIRASSAGNGSGNDNAMSFDNGTYGNAGFCEDGTRVLPIIENTVEENDDDDEEEQVVRVANEEEEGIMDHAQETLEKHNDDDNDDDSDMNPFDKLLHQAVCDALVNIKDKDLPMTATNFYAQYVKPRAATAASSTSNTTAAAEPLIVLDMKKTSWKKFHRYLQQQQDDGLLTCKAHGTDPMGYLTEIHRTHQDLRGRRKDDVNKSLLATTKRTIKLAVVNLYVIPHYVETLLRLDTSTVKAANAKSEERRGTGMLTLAEAKAILDDYVKDNEVNVSKQYVQLDGPLTDVLFKKHSGPLPTELTRKDLYKTWIAKMEPAYALVEMPGSHIRKLSRGSPPKVTIEVSLRKGRAKKYSTRVRGLEDYGIDPTVFCKDVSKRFACAGTVESNPEGRAALKKGRVELDFQGHLVEELKALLLGDERLSSHGGAKDSEYCLPKSAIEVVLKKKVPTKKPKK